MAKAVASVHLQANHLDLQQANQLDLQQANHLDLQLAKVNRPTRCHMVHQLLLNNHLAVHLYQHPRKGPGQICRQMNAQQWLNQMMTAGSIGGWDQMEPQRNQLRRNRALQQYQLTSHML